ncbi:MAG: nickel pincer cofactor biosynthesis protein LarC [Peptococcaceae bacterium]|nr:nickel pincer cofactor biosynthesis protein LarC [Peptococcaceae bacterium]
MRIAYFHCFAGISGDMTLGALVDAGLPLAQLEEDLAKLKLDFHVQARKVVKNGISGTKVDVEIPPEHVHRHFSDIVGIITASELPPLVQQKSVAVFRNLAEAEAKVHGTTPERIHFHEVGAVDAIVDIVGSVIGLWRLGVEAVYASPVQTGTGFVKCAHGVMPVPAPAVMELLQDVPIYAGDIEHELVTPTGAAILRTYCRDFGGMPLMRVQNLGYGAGQRDLTAVPNLLRVSIGEKTELTGSDGEVRYEGKGQVRQGQAVMMEVNIDDMNPEFYDYIFTKLLQAGAMDVFVQNIQMKKNRPACVLSVLVHAQQIEQFYGLIFAETSSIGVRVYPVTKYMLPYEVITCATEYGTAKVKLARLNNELCNVAPEYEDCQRLAIEHGLSIKAVYDLVKCTAYSQIRAAARAK